MTPWIEMWQPSLAAAEGLYRPVPLLDKLFLYFRYEGVASIALWLVALLLLLAYAIRWRRSLVCWAALAAAIGGLVLANVNSHNVSAIEIDFSQQLEAAKARAEERKVDEGRQAQRDEMEQPESEPRDEVKNQGTDQPPDDSASPPGPQPKYAYRQQGKVQREEGREVEDKISIDAGADEEDDADDIRLMTMQQVAEANRFDRLNLRFARWTLCLVLGLCVIDYFRCFNTTFGCYLPLPFSTPLIDSLFPKSLTVSVGRRRRNWKKYLARAVRKGETFVYFSGDDPWPQRRFRRMPWYMPLPWCIEKIHCSNGDRHFDDDFLFESAWFGRYCFVVSGDEQSAGDLLDALARFLDLRRATRARARHTVNVVWNLEADVPSAILDRLLPLCRETNFRLIVTRTTPSNALLADRFEETCE
jgi:hypothetical protein